MRVAGLDRTTWDVAVRVPAASLRRARAAGPAPDRLSRYGPVSWSPGGAVSLLLAAMAWRQHPARRDLDLCWLGVTAPMDLPTEPLVNYLLIPKRDAIRDEMARLFGLDELEGWYLGSTAPGPTGDPAAATETP